MGLFDQASDAMGQFLGTQADMLQLVMRLPEVLSEAGQQMHDAGVGADVAASLLTNDLLDLTNSSADLLDRIHRNTATFAHLLGEVGDRIRRVPLMGDVAAPFAQALQTAREMSDSLDRVSHQVRDLGVGLSAVGEGLGAMAFSLKSGGDALAAVSGTPITVGSMVPTAAAEATEQAARAALATAAAMAIPMAESARRVSDSVSAAAAAAGPAQRAVAKKRAAKKKAAKKTAAKKQAPAKKAAARKRIADD